MKHSILLTLAFAASLSFAQAQQKPYETMIDGVKVIVQPSGNDIVEIRTIIKGGVQNYSDKQAGIESLAMTALTECGTALYDKNTFKNKLDEVNAYVRGFAGKNYSTFAMNCIKSDFDKVWPLYAEALTQPKFEVKEFDRIKQDAINNLKSKESQPDEAIDMYAERVAFAGQPYARDPDGTPEIVKTLTAVQTKNYYNSILTRSRLLIIVVADLDKSVIESKIKALLNGIKPGAPFTLKKSSFSGTQNKFTSTSKVLATNYLEGITGGPQPGTKDFTAFSVAMQIFSQKHFLEIRTNNGLSYAPQSWFNGDATSSSRIAVSTTDPNKYITVLNTMMSKIKKDGFTEEELKDMKTTYLTRFFYKMETNAAQASSLASDEVLQNNWKRSIELMDEVKKLDLAEVNKAFKTYVVNTSWVYQGDVTKVNPLLFTKTTPSTTLPSNKPLVIKQKPSKM
jgi:zinc protease